jgi:hypothetical protein
MADSFFAACQNKIPKVKRYLCSGVKAEPHRLDRNWRLFFPKI